MTEPAAPAASARRPRPPDLHRPALAPHLGAKPAAATANCGSASTTTPAALIDTLRLARHAHPGEGGNNLATLLDRHQLTATVTELARDSQPHRALWDTTGTALLLGALITAQLLATTWFRGGV